MAYTFPGEIADLEAMLADSPHSITLGAVTRPCFYDLRGELGAETGGAAAHVLNLEVATIVASHFPAIAEGALVTIAEQPGFTGAEAWQRQYEVLRLVPSGATTELLLQRR